MDDTKIIVFDFDGVIVDSEHECHLVSLKAFAEMKETLEPSDDIKQVFHKLRPFIRHANDYFPLMKIIQTGTNVNKIDLEKFSNWRQEFEQKGKEFHDIFYKHRQLLKQSGMKRWLALHKAYPGIIDAIKKLLKHYKILIATNKDMQATLEILKHFGLDFNEKDVISKEFSLTKTDKIKKISEKLATPTKNILFVEDLLENLIEVKDALPDVKIGLVEWGYSTEQQRTQAKKLGILITKKDGIAEKIEKLINS